MECMYFIARWKESGRHASGNPFCNKFIVALKVTLLIRLKDFIRSNLTTNVNCAYEDVGDTLWFRCSFTNSYIFSLSTWPFPKSAINSDIPSSPGPSSSSIPDMHWISWTVSWSPPSYGAALSTFPSASDIIVLSCTFSSSLTMSSKASPWWIHLV
jgi:hypothetical protein